MASSITYYNFKKGLPIEFELISLAQLYQHHRQKLTSPHRTGFYHIIWFEKGETVHWVDFTPVEVSDGTLLFLNKDTVQQFDRAAAPTGKAILFTEHFFSQQQEAFSFLKSTVLFNDLLGTAHLHLGEADNAGIKDLFRHIEAELRHEADTYQPLLLHNALYSLLLLSERAYRTQGFQPIRKGADLDYTLLFKDELEARYKTARQVSFYATLLHVTEKRLNQATAKALGRTPKELIDERVMLEGKRLLAHTAMSVKEIGYELGFEEPTNFIKYFRKHQGQTPVEFRESFTG